MDLREQLVIWKKADFLLDNLAWTPRLQYQLVEEGVLTADMVADIDSYRYNVERKLRLLTLLGSHNTDVYRKFLKALEQAEHGALVKDIQRTYKLTKFGEMLPPSFTYFLDLSAFLRKYPHIGLKLGEDGKHLLKTYIEGKIQIEIRKHKEHLKTLEATNVRLVEEMKEMEARMAIAMEKQLAAEALWSTSGGRIDELKERIKDLENINRDSKREIRHMKHFYKIHADLEGFLEEEYSEYVPMVATSVTSSDLESTRSVRAVSETERQKFHLLQSQVGLNMVRLDLIRTSIQNLTREERRVEEVSECIAKTKPGEVDSQLAKEVSNFLEEIRKTKSQLEVQLNDGEHDLILHEKELADKEKKHEIPAEITVWTHTDLVGKLKATIENMRRAHASKMKEQKFKHGKEIDEMIERIQKMNQKHMEDVEKLKGTIRKKMFEIQKREQLHKTLRGQIRVMENYQARNMNATISVEQCRKIVRAIIGEARILRDIADEREAVVKQAEEEAERKIAAQANNKGKAGKKGKGKKGKGNKGKKKKIPESLNEDRLRYLSDKVKSNWRGLGALLGLTENRLDIVEMDAGSGSAERTAYYMLRVWRDEEAGRPNEIALALLNIGQQNLATLFLPMSKLLALKQAQEKGNETEGEEEEEMDISAMKAPVPTLPVIAVR